MDLFTLLSWLGTAFFTTALVPQLVRTVRRGRAEDISVWFLVTVKAASACMLAWSVSIGAYVVAAGFVVNIVVWGTVLVYRLRPRLEGPGPAAA